jgi:chaperone modulatory protein CbpM
VSTTLRPVKTTVIVHERAAQALELEALAREAGVHPDLVRRLVSLGLLDPRPGAPSFPRDAALQLARAVRLRRDLGLNYAGALLACELLDRIEQLERRLRRYEPVDRKRR